MKIFTVNLIIKLKDNMRLRWEVLYDDLENLVHQIDSPDIIELKFRAFANSKKISRVWLSKEEITQFELVTNLPIEREIDDNIDINAGALSCKEVPEA